MYRLIRRFRWLLIMIVPFLLSSVSLGEMLVTKYEVAPYSTSQGDKGSGKSAEAQVETNTNLLETKLRQVLEALEQSNPDRNLLTRLAQEIEELDRQISAEFSSTEAMLRSKNVSDSILKRHDDFVAQYHQKLQFLMDTLKPYDKGFLGINAPFSQTTVDNTAHQDSVEELKEKLRDEWLPQEFNPFKDGNFPKKNADFQPRELQTTPSIQPAYEYTQRMQSSSVVMGSIATYSSTPADLVETIEVQLTPEIKELARELDYNSVKIYEYVHNNIDYAPYYGSVKGAQETLWQKAGNDFDQASLLIALLRASGIPARYVYGVVEIPVEKVKNWIGIEHDQTALNTFSTNGIPAKVGMVGDKPKILQKEHVWVEAYVPVNHYRGSGSDQSGKVWVPMDPSFKQYTETKTVELDLSSEAESLVNQIRNNMTTGDNGASIYNVNLEFNTNLLKDFQKTVLSKIDTECTDADFEKLFGLRQILSLHSTILPLSLPYKVVSISSEFTMISNKYRHYVTLTLSNLNYYDDELIFRCSLPELMGKRTNLVYVPATQEDLDILGSYLPTFINEPPYVVSNSIHDSLPSYLINVKPQFIVEGSVKVTGAPINLGYEQELCIKFEHPINISDSKGIIINKAIAGAAYAITWNTGLITNKHLNNRAKVIGEANQRLKVTTLNNNNLKRGDYLGDILDYINLCYFYKLDTINKIIEKSAKVRVLRLPSEAISSINLIVESLFGLPKSISLGGINIDIDRDFYSVRSINGDKDKEKQFFLMEGPIGSYFEGGILEHLFKGIGVSTMHIFNQAVKDNIKLFTMNSTNYQEILPILEYSDSNKDILKQLILSGKQVCIPQKKITINNWSGTGYIALDPNDGTGAYIIDGGLNGGYTANDAMSHLLLGADCGETLVKTFIEKETLGAATKCIIMVGDYVIWDVIINNSISESLNNAGQAFLKEDVPKLVDMVQQTITALKNIVGLCSFMSGPGALYGGVASYAGIAIFMTYLTYLVPHMFEIAYAYRMCFNEKAYYWQE